MNPTTHPSLLEALKSPSSRPQACAAFDRLYRPTVVAWARGLGLQHADAEEVTQVILHRLLESLRAFDYDPAEGRFRGYLARVLRNAVADHFRERSRRPELQGAGGTSAQELLQQVAAAADGSAEGLATAMTAPRETAEWEAVCRVKARVEAATWECFRLSEVEGWSGEEVARATGKKEGAVYTAVHRVWKLIADERERVLRERAAAPPVSP
jgi:RNA polymerase sigma-70 factor (ECF subfamily)